MPSDSTALVPAGPARLPRRGYETEFLPAALEVVSTPASPTARLTAAAIAALFSGALAWSIMGHVDIMATAPGRVIPAGKVKVVQPLDSGVVQAILAADGDHVAAGQVLVVLDVTAAAAERERLARDLMQARLDAAGLLALRHDIETGAGLAAFAPPSDAPAAAVAVALAAVAARRDDQAAKLAALAQQIAGKQAEAAENAATIAKLQATLPLLQQKRDLYRTLLDGQLTSRVTWLAAEQAYVEGAHDLAIQQLRVAELEAGRRTLERQLEGQRAAYAHEVLKDLAEAQQRADELAQQFAAAAHKAAQTDLRAPVAGTVQQLAVHTVGGVVTPAEPLLTVVPDDAPVLVEATVANDDIGFVRAGQDAEVKVRTFPYTRYGLLHGHVLDVSRDAVPQDASPGRPGTVPAAPGEAGTAGTAAPSGGYVAHIALDRTSLDVDGQAQKLEPGMEVTAEIKTGRRRVISYLLSPLQRYAHEAGEER